MTSMMPPPPAPAGFGAVITALERGVWIPCLRVVPAELDGSERLARLTVMLRQIAASQNDQVLGDVETARDRLAAVAGMLPTALRRLDGGRVSALAPLSSPPGDGWENWISRTARLVFRELAGLDELEALVRPGRCSPEEICRVAFGEYLRWVECDAQLFRGRPLPRIPYAIGPTALCDRATRLCRLADRLSAGVDESAWVAAGRQVGIRSATLLWLATHPLVPADGPGRVPTGVPVRCARAAAYRLASGWLEDLAAS